MEGRGIPLNITIHNFLGWFAEYLTTKCDEKQYLQSALKSRFWYFNPYQEPFRFDYDKY